MLENHKIVSHREWIEAPTVSQQGVQLKAMASTKSAPSSLRVNLTQVTSVEQIAVGHARLLRRFEARETLTYLGM